MPVVQSTVFTSVDLIIYVSNTFLQMVSDGVFKTKTFYSLSMFEHKVMLSERQDILFLALGRMSMTSGTKFRSVTSTADLMQM